MSQFESLPDDVKSKLKTNPLHTSGNELLPAEVATVIYEADRPIWTATQVQAELDTGHGTETVRNKLKTLDEVDICGSMEANNGRIYWWNDDRSDWPIAPDVAVESRQGLTIQELLTPWYAKLGLLGFLGPALAGIPIVIGIFAIGGTISIPVSGTELLSGGLIAIVLSYVLLVYASALGAIEWATGDGLDVSPLSKE